MEISFSCTTISKSSGSDFCFNIYIFISAAQFRLKFVSFADRLTCFLGSVCSSPPAPLPTLTWIYNAEPPFSTAAGQGSATFILFKSPEHFKVTTGEKNIGWGLP